MSLVNFAIRTCLKRALLDRTWAERRVFDSMVTPLDETLPEGTRPQIIVSTDDDETTMTSFDLNADGRQLVVIIEIELASEVQVDAGGYAMEIPQTDAGLEATLDFIQRQVERALAEPASLWADLFRRLVDEPSKRLKRRGAGADKGVRFAARQLMITCQPSNEPAYGAAPNKLWTAIAEAMRGDPELADYADLLEAEITGQPLPAWATLQATLGYSDAGVRNLGPAPYDPTEKGEPPVMRRAVLSQVNAAGATTRLSTASDEDPAP